MVNLEYSIKQWPIKAFENIICPDLTEELRKAIIEYLNIYYSPPPLLCYIENKELKLFKGELFWLAWLREQLNPCILIKLITNPTN